MNVLHRTIASTGIFLAISLASLTALSQDRVPCGERTGVLTHLESEYSETVTAMGLDTTGRVIEVLSSPSGTWTMLVSSPDGFSCLIASGVAWEELQAKLPGERS